MTAGSRRFLSNRAVLLAVAAVAVVAAMSVAAFLFVEARVDTILTMRQATVVDSELQLLQTIDREEGRAALVRTIERRLSVPNDDLPIHALIDPSGRYLAGDVDWPDAAVADGSWRPIATFKRQHGQPVTGFGRAVVLRDGAKVLVGRDQTGLHTVQSALVEAMVAALVVLFAVAIVLGVLLNRVVLQRIDAIAATARRIIAGNLHERVPLRGEDNELDRLSGVLNSMLDRNETHIDQMRMVTEAIAHDLRLPFQRVKADLERAQSSGDAGERQLALARADNEIDGALATFNALLEITRAESGVGADAFETVDLGDIVRDVVELFGPVAEDKAQALLAQAASATVEGHSTLLRQAVGNLVENAIKFSPEGAAIAVRLERDGAAVRLIVEDNGPGIPEGDRATALKPFERLARDRETDGKGLGLALVAACAKLHRGRLVLESAGPGLRAVIELPRHSAG